MLALQVGSFLITNEANIGSENVNEKLQGKMAAKIISVKGALKIGKNTKQNGKISGKPHSLLNKQSTASKINYIYLLLFNLLLCGFLA